MGRRLSCWVAVMAAVVAVALGVARPAYSASLVAVDCAADPGALLPALVGANDGDTLAIDGTCKGTFGISRNLTLMGSEGATLDAQGAGRVLAIGSAATVVIDGVRITGGNGDNAGGILNFGTLTLMNSTVTGNTATPPSSPLNDGAGGILNDDGRLRLVNTTVSGNSATVLQFRNGVGAILNVNGLVTLTDSTVRGNSASAVLPLDTVVGGIATFGSAFSGGLKLINSTVSGNSANGPSLAFGGIINSSPGSIATITNSTVSGNSASASGGQSDFAGAVGGIANDGGNLTLTADTVAGNTVTQPNAGFRAPVGGIGNFDGGTVTATNTLVAGQSGAPNCDGLAAGADGGYNLDDGASCGFSTGNNSLSTTDPMLDPAGLNDNGGSTQTIALLSGSPAIDAIPSGASGCGTTLTTDQRGVTRPQGASCDIGAFELAEQTPTQLLAVLGNLVTGVGPGRSLADKVAQAQADLGSDDVPDTCATLNAFISELKAQKAKTITPALADDLIARAQRIEALLGC
jgi:hypothetical protein